MTNILTDAETWLSNEYTKLKTWATQEIQAGEQFIETEAHALVSDGIGLLTKIAPSLLTQLKGAWTTAIGKLEAGASLDEIEQAVIQEAEVLGEDVVAAVNALGSPSLQALFALFKAVAKAL